MDLYKDPYTRMGRLALSFNDVVLLPHTGSGISLEQVDLTTEVVRGVNIRLPIVSAAMDTVTGARMAIAMARLGGLGVIHRGGDLVDIEAQAAAVRQVKRSQSGMVTDPVTVSPDQTIKAVRELMKTYHHSGFPVVEDGRLVGLITNRDQRYIEDADRKVRQAMTPVERLKTRPVGTTREEAKRFFEEEKLEKLPLVDHQGNLVGMYTSKDVDKEGEYPLASLDAQHRLMVGAAVGVYLTDTMARAEALISAGADILVMDVKNGHTAEALSTLKAMRQQWSDIPIIPGNVITPAGVEAQIQSGASAVKVGIGVGSICTSTDVTGVGMPQFSAVLECAAVANHLGVPVMADGGFRFSSDIVKALAAGASSIMTGRMLAGTDEAPTQVLAEDQNMRLYRGMGSRSAQSGRYTGRYKDSRVVEGVEGAVPYQGSVETVVTNLMNQVRVALPELGARGIPDLWNAEFRQVTSAAQAEAHPHDIYILTSRESS